MADDHFVLRAARVRRLITVLLVLVVSGACMFFAVRNTFFDRCTNSYERGAETVTQSYLTALAGGDAARTQSCWVREQFFKLEAGCSEICLTKVLGSGFTVTATQVGVAYETESRRSALDVQVAVQCPDGSQHSGVLVLDSLAGFVPWKHWRVSASTVGGTAVDAWCD